MNRIGADRTVRWMRASAERSSVVEPTSVASLEGAAIPVDRMGWFIPETAVGAFWLFTGSFLVR